MFNNPQAISPGGAWAMNIVSSVGLIMINKVVMSSYRFLFATILRARRFFARTSLCGTHETSPFSSFPPPPPPPPPRPLPSSPPTPSATTLTGFHLTFTGLFGALCVWLGYLSGTANIPLWDIVWFGMLANLSIVGMNLSLMSNSVGFYQISKLAIIPVTCLCETLLHAKAYSKEVKLSVLAVMLGVGVCTVTDISVNAFGLITASVAVVSTSLQQIFVGELQRKHNVGSFDLLRQTAPIQAVTLVVVGPFLDYLLTSQNLLEFPVTSNAAVSVKIASTTCSPFTRIGPCPVLMFPLSSNPIFQPFTGSSLALPSPSSLLPRPTTPYPFPSPLVHLPLLCLCCQPPLTSHVSHHFPLLIPLHPFPSLPTPALHIPLLCLRHRTPLTFVSYVLLPFPHLPLIHLYSSPPHPTPVLHLPLLRLCHRLQPLRLPVHRKVLGNVLPGAGAHENGGGTHSRLDRFQGPIYSQEFQRHAHGYCRHAAVQLGCGEREGGEGWEGGEGREGGAAAAAGAERRGRSGRGDGGGGEGGCGVWRGDGGEWEEAQLPDKRGERLRTRSDLPPPPTRCTVRDLHAALHTIHTLPSERPTCYLASDPLAASHAPYARRPHAACAAHALQARCPYCPCAARALPAQRAAPAVPPARVLPVLQLLLPPAPSSPALPCSSRAASAARAAPALCSHSALPLLCRQPAPCCAAAAATLLLPPAPSSPALPCPSRAALPSSGALPSRPAELPLLTPLLLLLLLLLPLLPPPPPPPPLLLLLLLLPLLLLPTMATITVLALDAKGRPIKFDTWLEDLQLYLRSESRDSVSLFEHTSGSLLAQDESADHVVRSHWLTRDATARLAVRNHLPLDERAHFGQHKTAKDLYDAVVARYSSPSTAALGRLMLPYIFPELSDFHTVADIITHLRSIDARYLATLKPAFLTVNPPPRYITLYFLVTRLPDSLRAVRDHVLALDPTEFKLDLLQKHLLEAETSAVAVAASRGTPRSPFF
ncbi:unnamed protein product [Closterium sp. NIES-54]